MNAPTEAPVIAQFALSRQREVVAALRAVLPAHCVLFNEEDTRPYECDGLSAYRQLPMVVVLGLQQWPAWKWATLSRCCLQLADSAQSLLHLPPCSTW